MIRKAKKAAKMMVRKAKKAAKKSVKSRKRTSVSSSSWVGRRAAERDSSSSSWLGRRSGQRGKSKSSEGMAAKSAALTAQIASAAAESAQKKSMAAKAAAKKASYKKAAAKAAAKSADAAKAAAKARAVKAAAKADAKKAAAKKMASGKSKAAATVVARKAKEAKAAAKRAALKASLRALAMKKAAKKASAAAALKVKQAKTAAQKATIKMAAALKAKAKQASEARKAIAAKVAAKKKAVRKAKKKAVSDGWFGDAPAKLTIAQKAAKQARKAAQALAMANRAEKEAARQQNKLEQMKAHEEVASEFKSSTNAWNCQVPASKLPICDRSSSLKIGKMGMGSGRIPDCAIIGSSTQDGCSAHIGGRLFGVASKHKSQQKKCHNVWRPDQTVGQAGDVAMTIDLGYIAKVTAVQMRGQLTKCNCVGPYSFNVATSLNGRDFELMKPNQALVPFQLLNIDLKAVGSARGSLNKPAMHNMPVPLVARYVKIIVTSAANFPNFAAEIYGTTHCQYSQGIMPIGVGSAVPSGNFQVSNGNRKPTTLAAAARLGLKEFPGPSTGLVGSRLGVWPSQFFQMDTDRAWDFRFVATQMPDSVGDNAVHSFTITYSNIDRQMLTSAIKYKPYSVSGNKQTTFFANDCTSSPSKENLVGGRKCVKGNEGRPYSVTADKRKQFGIVTNEFIPSFTANSVRLQPKAWGKKPATSVEFYVAATKFDWNKVSSKDLAASVRSCSAIFRVSDRAFNSWSQGLNGDNLVWRSGVKIVASGKETFMFMAYRKGGVVSSGCGQITKELVCLSEVKTGSKEKCCVRKESKSLCDRGWKQQGRETRVF